jgi:GAF domain-containing protein/HAMP domain-containing protein
MQNRKATRTIPRIRASLGVKLIVLALFVVMIALGFSAYQGNRAIRSNLKNDSGVELEKISSVLASELDGDQAAAAMVAISIANREDIQKLAVAKDRQALAEILAPLFNSLNEQYKVVHLNIIDERGVVILRVNDLANFDDYVLYNYVVSNTIDTRQPTSGLEVDISGLSMRGAAPMFRDGRMIGLVEVGIDYSQTFANFMKQKTGADFTIWFYKPSTARFGVDIGRGGPVAANDNFIYYAGTKAADFQASSADFEKAFVNSERVFNIFFNDDRVESSLLVPILGPDGTFFGVTEINIDYSERFQAEQRDNILGLFSTLGLSALALLGAGIAINFLIVSPLVRITHFANELSSGELAGEISLKTGDEFEQVSEALQQMGQAIQEKREDLEKQVNQRTAQLRASNEVARAANATLNPDELISKVVNLITAEFDYYYAAIFIVEDNGRWAVLRDATGSAGQILKSRRHRLQVGTNSMVGSAISSKEARIALDVGESAQRFNNPLLPNTRSEIALPLIVGDRVIGALDVQSVREADFKAEDIDTLQSMANQVGIALENARLFQEMDDALRELNQANRETLISAWSDSARSNALEHNIKLPMTSSNPDIKEVQIPLSLREQNIGQITIETENEWTVEDQSWAESLATQVAVSIENARLFEESQQAALRERISSAIIQKIWSAGSIDAILQTTVRELSRALGANEASIQLNVKEDDRQ